MTWRPHKMKSTDPNNKFFYFILDTAKKVVPKPILPGGTSLLSKIHWRFSWVHVLPLQKISGASL